MTRFRAAMADMPTGFLPHYSRLLGNLLRLGHSPTSPPFAIFANMDGNGADVEAGFVLDAAVGARLPASELTRLPARRVATLVHRGSYRTIDRSYLELLRGLDQQGVVRDGSFMESYLNSPLDTPSSELLTKLIVPVRSC